MVLFDGLGEERIELGEHGLDDLVLVTGVGGERVLDRAEVVDERQPADGVRRIEAPGVRRDVEQLGPDALVDVAVAVEDDRLVDVEPVGRVEDGEVGCGDDRHGGSLTWMGRSARPSAWIHRAESFAGTFLNPA